MGLEAAIHLTLEDLHRERHEGLLWRNRPPPIPVDESQFISSPPWKADIASFPSCSPSGKHITFVFAECGRAVDVECGAPLTWPRTGF
jgi:hypothetical protein